MPDRATLWPRNCGRHHRAQSHGALRGNKNQLRSDPPDVVVEISSLGVVDCERDVIRFAHVASSSFVSKWRTRVISLRYETARLKGISCISLSSASVGGVRVLPLPLQKGERIGVRDFSFSQRWVSNNHIPPLDSSPLSSPRSRRTGGDFNAPAVSARNAKTCSRSPRLRAIEGELLVPPFRHR